MGASTIYPKSLQMWKVTLTLFIIYSEAMASTLACCPVVVGIIFFKSKFEKKTNWPGLSVRPSILGTWERQPKWYWPHHPQVLIGLHKDETSTTQCCSGLSSDGLATLEDEHVPKKIFCSKLDYGVCTHIPVEKYNNHLNHPGEMGRTFCTVPKHRNREISACVVLERGRAFCTVSKHRNGEISECVLYGKGGRAAPSILLTGRTLLLIALPGEIGYSANVNWGSCRRISQVASTLL